MYISLNNTRHAYPWKRTRAGFSLAKVFAMRFSKPALTIDQQLDQLVNRGMDVGDRASANHYLRHINYYRLRAYWLPYETAARLDEHAFAPQTTLATILDLYAFDRKLRLLVLDAIERIEVSLRARWANVLSLRYGSHAYAHRELFNDGALYHKCIARLHTDVAESKEIFVRHYRSKYSDPSLPPIWSIAEILTFGQLSMWIKNLRHGPDRAAISSAYGIDEQVLVSFAHHLSYVRNVCAHHSRLWNREMTVAMKLPSNPSWLKAEFNRAAERRLFNTLVMLVYVLGIISPGSHWRQSVCKLVDRHPHVDVASMGFPRDWRGRELWRG